MNNFSSKQYLKYLSWKSHLAKEKRRANLGNIGDVEWLNLNMR